MERIAPLLGFGPYVAELAELPVRRVWPEVALAFAYQAAVFWALDLTWQGWLAAYYLFALHWSALQYVDHAWSPRDIRDGAWNLRVFAPVRWIALNYHYHLAHHHARRRLGSNCLRGYPGQLYAEFLVHLPQPVAGSASSPADGLARQSGHLRYACGLIGRDSTFGPVVVGGGRRVFRPLPGDKLAHDAAHEPTACTSIGNSACRRSPVRVGVFVDVRVVFRAAAVHGAAGCGRWASN